MRWYAYVRIVVRTYLTSFGPSGGFADVEFSTFGGFSDVINPPDIRSGSSSARTSHLSDEIDSSVQYVLLCIRPDCRPDVFDVMTSIGRIFGRQVDAHRADIRTSEIRRTIFPGLIQP